MPASTRLHGAGDHLSMEIPADRKSRLPRAPLLAEEPAHVASFRERLWTLAVSGSSIDLTCSETTGATDAGDGHARESQPHSIR